MTGDNRQLQQNQDAFNNLVTERTNVLDIAAHYPYNPERWRLFVDGSRVFPEYNSVSQYNHDTDVHQLQPAGGETVVFETAERPRYVVQYELAATWAFVLNQSLSGNDQIRIGLYDGTDGWYLEHNSDHLDDRADFVNERNGTEQYREEDIDIIDPVTTFSRLKLTSGWYNITRQEWERSYTNDGTQINAEIGSFSVDDGRGPEVGNLPLRYEVTADASTSDLILEAGSCAQVNLGRTTALTRNKVDQETANVDTANTWVPILAFRTDPDKKIVNTQFTDAAITEFGASADIQLSINAFDASNVADADGNQLTDSDFFVPALFSATNNSLQVSSAVEQVADSTGTLQTSMSDPGGFQIGFDALSTGGGNTVTDNSPGPVASKRPLYPQDIAVVLANAGGTGDVTVQYRTEQDW